MFDNAGDTTAPPPKPPSTVQDFLDDAFDLIGDLGDTCSVSRIFPPAHRPIVTKTLLAWSIRLCSLNYEPIPPGGFLLAVPVTWTCAACGEDVTGCWGEMFDARELWLEAPIPLHVSRIAYDLLGSITYGVPQPATAGLLHTLARRAVDDPGSCATLSRAIKLARPVCVFVDEFGPAKQQQLGAIAIPTVSREAMRRVLVHGDPVPPPAYARAIFAGVAGQGPRGHGHND